MAADPEILLMDEPFGALDPVTRAILQEEIQRIHRLSGKTILLVTHDIDEALSLADHLVLMDKGHVVQQGTPAQILSHPANDFVRDFIGRNDLGIKMLSLQTVGQCMRSSVGSINANEFAISDEASLKEALSSFVAHGVDALPVINAAAQPVGTLHLNDLVMHHDARV